MLKRLKMERGTALVLTLLIIITLAGLALGFSGESGVELTLAGYMKDSARAYQLARSGVDIALELLARDEDLETDSLNEDWSQLGGLSIAAAMMEQGVSFAGGMVDESGKININLLLNDQGEIDEKREAQLRRLFLALGVKEEVLNPLLDWLDADDIERQDGAEGFYYQNLEHPYECANGRFLTVGQIFMVRGMRQLERFGEEKEKKTRRLLDYVTIYSEGKININTAPKEVLESLGESMDSALAESIMEFRKEESFESVEDLKKVAGVDQDLLDEIRELISVKSSTFSIEAHVNNGGAVASVKTVVRRQGNNAKLIYWQVL
ncbi:MAG: type II secretion system minor pseudopilin GspK [Deltaproteobacteria bacterium]